LDRSELGVFLRSSTTVTTRLPCCSG